MNVGPAEIIVVLVIALLVFGPKRLPQMGRQLGRGVREFKNAAATARTELGLDDVLTQVNDVKNDVTSSLGLVELKAGIDDVKTSMGVDEITAGVGSVKAAMDFDPRKAAKSMVMGKPSSGGEEKDGEATAGKTEQLEPSAPATGEASLGTEPAGDDEPVVPPAAAAADEPLAASDAAQSPVPSAEV